MKDRYFGATVKPNIDVTPVTAYADADILFDWTAIDIPKGASRLTGITALVRGTNGAAQVGSGHDIELFFAKTINGVAPPTLGTLNEAVGTGVTAGTGKGAWMNHIMARAYLDASGYSNDADLIYLNVISEALVNSEMLIVDPEPNSGANVGYDRIYVAAIAKAAFDFNTGVILNGGHSVSTTQTTLAVTSGGTDPDLVFAVGDELIAQDGALIGNVVSLDSNIQMTVDGITAALANADEICNRQPITLKLGFAI